MAKVSHHHTLLALVLIIIGAVVVAFMLTKENEPVDNSEVEEHIEGEEAQNFNFLMPEAWSYTDNAIKDIQSLTPAQVLSFGVVQSKSDEGVYYFMTSAPDPKNEGQTLWSTYQYNSDYTFERIYRLSLNTGKEFVGIRKGAEVALHAIGHDGDKLIVLAQDADSSPGPCTEILTLGREADDEVYEMLSLDITAPFAQGLQPYEVPEDIYDQALERQNDCVNQ